MATIKHDGDTWRIIGKGSEREGKILCHLASITRGRHQKNGFVPVQICDWIDQRVVEDAESPITEYYQDRTNSGRSPLEAHR